MSICVLPRRSLLCSTGGKVMERQYDLVIIGAGPAGMSAAVYGSRAGLKTLILENSVPGGKLTKTHKISNYP